MSDDDTRSPDDDGSALDDVTDDQIEDFEQGIDTEDLDDDEQITLDDAARSLLAKPRGGHGPIARLYRGETRFDFVGKRKIWFSVSALIILLGILSIILRGGLNLGIEFKGGTEWTIAAPGVTQTQAVNAINGTGLVDPTVQLLGSGNNQTLTVQSDLNKDTFSQQQEISNKVVAAMTHLTAGHTTSSSHDTTTSAPASTTSTSSATSSTTTTTTSPSNDVPKTVNDKVSITTVGPTWGSSITDDAIKALIIFFIVVGIYISIRFEPKMAASAFIAMVHDVLIAIGIYSIFNFQVTPDTVVAILTILGYSLYDTVVVFDRVRDNTKGIGSSGRLTYPQLINLSMNQTLARSINTSAVAILPVLSVLLIGANLLGATTLQSYGLALFVGLLSGAYSSIFIASPVLCMMKEREDRWVAIANRLAKRGEAGAFYSAVDAAGLNTAMSMAAAGQGSRGGGGGAAPAASRSGTTKRSGLIRPGSGSGQGAGSGSGSNGGGTTTTVMERTPGDGSGSGGAAGSTAPAGPRPRKSKGKRKR